MKKTLALSLRTSSTGHFGKLTQRTKQRKYKTTLLRGVGSVFIRKEKVPSKLSKNKCAREGQQPAALSPSSPAETRVGDKKTRALSLRTSSTGHFETKSKQRTKQRKHKTTLLWGVGSVFIRKEEYQAGFLKQVCARRPTTSSPLTKQPY